MAVLLPRGVPETLAEETEQFQPLLALAGAGLLSSQRSRSCGGGTGITRFALLMGSGDGAWMRIAHVKM